MLNVNDRVVFFYKQKTAYEMCGRDWSSDVCSSDLVDIGFLTNHSIVFVVGVVSVSKFAIRSKFKLQKLVTKLSFMSNIIPQVEIRRGSHRSTTFFKYMKDQWEYDENANGNGGCDLEPK